MNCCATIRGRRASRATPVFSWSWPASRCGYTCRAVRPRLARRRRKSRCDAACGLGLLGRPRAKPQAAAEGRSPVFPGQGQAEQQAGVINEDIGYLSGSPGNELLQVLGAGRVQREKRQQQPAPALQRQPGKIDRQEGVGANVQNLSGGEILAFGDDRIADFNGSGGQQGDGPHPDTNAPAEATHKEFSPSVLVPCVRHVSPIRTFVIVRVGVTSLLPRCQATILLE